MALYECKLYYNHLDEFLLLEVLMARIKRVHCAIKERKAIADIVVSYLLLGAEAKNFEFEAFEAVCQVERQRETLGAAEVILLTRWGCKAATVVPNLAIIRNGAKNTVWAIELDNPHAPGRCAKLNDYFGKERTVCIDRKF